MVAVISCCTVQVPKQHMLYSRYMFDEISYHTIIAIIYLARVTSCLSDSVGHDRRWLRMSGITPDTKLRLRKVTARFLNCNTCTQGRVLSLGCTWLWSFSSQPYWLLQLRGQVDTSLSWTVSRVPQLSVQPARHEIQWVLCCKSCFVWKWDLPQP